MSIGRPTAPPTGPSASPRCFSKRKPADAAMALQRRAHGDRLAHEVNALAVDPDPGIGGPEDQRAPANRVVLVARPELGGQAELGVGVRIVRVAAEAMGVLVDVQRA